MCLWMKDTGDANEVTRPTRHNFVIFLGEEVVAYFAYALT